MRANEMMQPTIGPIASLAKSLLIVAVIGVAYYHLYLSLVGRAAAIGYPDWYGAFAHANKILSLVAFSMVTTVPAAMISGALAGFAIAKLVSSHQVVWAVAIVVGSTLYMAIPVYGSDNYFTSLIKLITPTHLIDAPMYIVWWTFFPGCTALFARRLRAKNRHSTSSS